MAWIELHQTMPQHPKTKRLARALGLKVPQDIPNVVGHLCMFWLWCLDFAADGDVSKWSEDELSDAAGWQGDPAIFVDAMCQTGYLDADDDGGLSVHGWDKYTSRYQDLQFFREESRKKNCERQRRYRERKKAEAEAAAQEAAALSPDGTPPPYDDPEADIVDDEWLKVAKCYESNLGLLPVGKALDTLVSYVEDMGGDVVCEAIEITNLAQVDVPYTFLNKILKGWIEAGVDSVEKAKAFTKDHERRIANSKKNGEQPVPKKYKFY